MPIPYTLSLIATDQGDEMEGVEMEGLERLFFAEALTKKNVFSQCHLQLHL
jgi:hypothetical protein